MNIKPPNYFLAINLKKTVMANEIYKIVSIHYKNNIKVNLTHADNIHITVFYLGALNSFELEILNEQLPGILSLHKPFNIKLNKTEVFQKHSRSSEVILIDSDNDSLVKLHYDLKSKLLKFFPNALDCKTSRSYNPHITIGRCKDSIDSGLEQVFFEINNMLNKNIEYLVDCLEILYLDQKTKKYITQNVLPLI